MSGHHRVKWGHSEPLLLASLDGDVLKSDASEKVVSFVKGKNEAACTEWIALEPERNLHPRRGGEAGVCAENPAH